MPNKRKGQKKGSKLIPVLDDKGKPTGVQQEYFYPGSQKYAKIDPNHKRGQRGRGFT